jgi:CRISPR-associated protein Cas2
MFISLSIDLVSQDSANQFVSIMNEYGIKKILANLYESFDFPSNKLGNLKRDITNCLDSFDKLRMYQFPLENTFKISYVENRKWKRLSFE